MPVVLAPETWPAWLGEEPTDPGQLKALLAPYPSEGMTCWLVSARVGNVKNNDASLIEPLLAVSSVGMGYPIRNFSTACRSISMPRPGRFGMSTQPSLCMIGSSIIAIRIGCSD